VAGLVRNHWQVTAGIRNIAVNAILNDQTPGCIIKYKTQSRWKEYISFTNNIVTIFGHKNISRNIDQALWVYGHCFKKPKKSNYKTC